MNAIEGRRTTSTGPSFLDKYFTGTGVVALCCATPVGIMLLHMFKIPINASMLIAAGVAAVVGLALALADQQEEQQGPEGGAPEDDF